MLSRVFTKSVVALMLSLIAGTSAAFGQIWLEETPRFPVYSRLIRQYKELKPTIDRGKMTPTVQNRVLAKLIELRSVAAQLKKNAESDPNGSEELKSRCTMFVRDLDRNITRLQQTKPTPAPGPLPSGASMRLTANTTIFAPADDVEFRFTLPEGLQGKVWVGIMKSSEPHRELPYLEPSININPYQPKSLESRADGVFQYSAPQSGGMYDVRMFDKESGREITTAQFRVEDNFVEELRAWKKELFDARAQVEARYGSNAIRGTFVAAFSTAGADDWNGYASSWGERFWLDHTSTYQSTAGFAFYHKPLERVSDSLRNITAYRLPYSNEDVQHYRQAMRTWRVKNVKLFPLFEEYIRIEADRNRDMKETRARVRALSGAAREAEEKAAAKRSDARRLKATQVVGKINELKLTPIFAFTAATPKKPA